MSAILSKKKINIKGFELNRLIFFFCVILIQSIISMPKYIDYLYILEQIEKTFEKSGISGHPKENPLHILIYVIIIAFLELLIKNMTFKYLIRLVLILIIISQIINYFLNISVLTYATINTANTLAVISMLIFGYRILKYLTLNIYKKLKQSGST